jgi:hypothetical protein
LERLAGAVGAFLLIVCGGSIVIGRAGFATVVLVLMSGPLVYGGSDVPMPSIKAGGVRLRFKPSQGGKHDEAPRPR